MALKETWSGCTLSYRSGIGLSELCAPKTFTIAFDLATNLSPRGMYTHTGVNTLRPRQYGRHFPDDIFKRICLNENVSISLKISLKFVPKVQFNNISALLQIMAWRRPGDKPLSEPMVVSLLAHICVTRPQWVNRALCSSYIMLCHPRLELTWYRPF